VIFNPSITQKELADKIGYSVNTVKGWESGRRKPSKEAMDKISELFKETK
jgi:transcriptional regulator with XRE-family HTH domain